MIIIILDFVNVNIRMGQKYLQIGMASEATVEATTKKIFEWDQSPKKLGLLAQIGQNRIFTENSQK